MDLAPSQDQAAIKEAFAELFRRESTPERVREAEDAGFDPALWELLVELGAPGIAVSEELGGAGTGLVELVLLAEEVGRRIACVPLIEAAVAARVLAAAAAEPGAAELLEALLGGEPVVFAPRPAIDGVARLVPAGTVAAAVVARDGEELVAVRGPAGPAVNDLGFQAAADRPLRGDGVERTVLAVAAAAEELWAEGLAAWQVATAATFAGLGAEAIRIGAQYSNEREQFGVPIGSFQALQQLLAGEAIAVDGGELIAREAAWRGDQGLDSWRQMALIAFAHGAAAAERACAASLHVHGGYGYTLEYEIQLYLRRAKALGLALGDIDRLWESIGAATVKEVD